MNVYADLTTPHHDLHSPPKNPFKENTREVCAFRGVHSPLGEKKFTPRAPWLDFRVKCVVFFMKSEHRPSNGPELGWHHIAVGIIIFSLFVWCVINPHKFLT